MGKHKDMLDKAAFRWERHPDFDATWEQYSGLVFWWAKKAARILNSRTYRGRGPWNWRDFVGYITIRLNHCLWMVREERGTVKSLINTHMMAAVMVDVVKYESEYWRAVCYRRYATAAEIKVGSINREFYESDYFLYRAPDKHDDEWTSQILDLFDTPDKTWEFLTDGLKQKAKDVLVYRYKHGKKFHEIGELLGVTKQRIEQIEKAALKSIRMRLQKLEVARSLFYGDGNAAESPSTV